MSLLLLAVIFPLLGAVGLCVTSALRTRQILNVCLSAGGFGITLIVWGVGFVDPLEAWFGVLSGFVGLSAALIDINSAALRAGSRPAQRGRYDQTLFQVLLSMSLMGLYVNNIGLLWCALAIETISVALGVGQPRTRSALQAAWSYLLFNGVGLALALFGTLLVSLAVETAAEPKLSTMSFTALSSGAVQFNQAWLCLGFVFVTLGYGIKAVLVPLYDLVGESYADGPVGFTCILRGLSTNVILLAILRFRYIVHAHASAAMPTDFLLSLAIASIFLSTFALFRQNDVRRFLGVMASGQAAITLFAFGVGGAVAIFAGLLQMLLWSLLRSGLFGAFARAADETQSGVSFRNIPKANKYAIFVFGLALFAATGLPPSGLYVSEFIIIRQTALYNLWVVLPLCFCLLACFFLIIRRVGRVLLVHVSAQTLKINDWRVNVALLHLVLFLLFAYAMPSPLYHMLTQAAKVWQ